ncbi:MAG: di-trans,poly-cis-decaprenylcistransferase, partial [Bryobacterales bacterium]|nr:di-trans,poly-cis-decaprenylcistransferase [Bryobacterales bacterium]
MSQSTSSFLHAAIIMDGNGRWASTRGLPRIAGHRAGAEALRRSVEAAPSLGIGVLTVFAFSSDNWRRPQPEVSALMKMFHTYLRREQAKCVEKGVRVSLIGRRDRLPRLLLPVIDECESATAPGERLHLRLAVDYSSRDTILAAASALKGKATREKLSETLGAQDVDLLIRTGGEQRLSDFLLWECAYA